MSIRTCMVLSAFASLLAANSALAQNAAPKPPPAPKAPAAAAPAPAAPVPAPNAPAEGAPARPELPADAGAVGDEEAAGAEPGAVPAAPAAPTAATPPSRTVLPAFPEPGNDARTLSRMGTERPEAAKAKEESDVFAEDWWSHVRPVVELHGNFRVRSELFYRFSLGRVDPPNAEGILWPRPPDSPYASDPTNPYNSDPPRLCTADEAGTGDSSSLSSPVPCRSNTQAGANMRFRLNPEIHISDNLRILSQIDLLDNLVLGSTGMGTASGSPDASLDIHNAARAVDATMDTQNATVSGTRNSFSDTIRVKRAWAEYMSPVGALRFGRMPNHWGLGMVNHSGDGYDDDYQSTIDRVQFIAGIKPLDLYASAAWDFPYEGPTSAVIGRTIPREYDLGQLDDVDQYTFSIARRKSPELLRLALTRGEVVVNGGLQLTYRKQLLQAQTATTALQTSGIPLEYVRRDSHYYLPDLWLQVLYKQFRFETEIATVQGSIANPDQSPSPINTDRDLTRPRFKIRQWGFVGEIEQRLIEDRLRFGAGFGWASGDPDEESMIAASSGNTFGQLGGDRTLSSFRFNPAYRVDLILFRNLLTRVQGAYYVRPNISYDFVHDSTGQRIGGSIAGIWSRASQFVQAPGHDRDLGIEINGALYYQSKDGSLNDDRNRMGGFYARLEYGILFPMAGLGYGNVRAADLNGKLNRNDAASTSAAQTLRLFLGAAF
ncbi:MAG TPA: TIGR04551 family protein [Polyangiaceae bacterium]|nr:TIGR04551 family protein [Polyangiaceae bacterium]